MISYISMIVILRATMNKVLGFHRFSVTPANVVNNTYNKLASSIVSSNVPCWQGAKSRYYSF